MKITVMEFIKSSEHTDELISGDEVVSQSQVTSHQTTDQAAHATMQGVSFSNYRRYPTEAVLPFAEQADQLAEQPQAFMDFLREQGAEDQFEQYFTPATNESTQGKYLTFDDLKAMSEQLAKEATLKMTERLLSQKRSDPDVIRREIAPTMTIDEVRGKSEHRLIVEKLEKVAGYCKSNMSEDERKVILSHFNSLING